MLSAGIQQAIDMLGMHLDARYALPKGRSGGALGETLGHTCTHCVQCGVTTEHFVDRLVFNLTTKSATKPRSSRTTVKRQTRSCRMPRPGQKCPQCGKGKLDYDGLLNLVCPQCGQAAFVGSFT